MKSFADRITIHTMMMAGFFLAFSATAEPVDYAQQIQPIFDRYCVACHACFDAPCQLNLGSGKGVRRGATQQLVYDAARLEDADPTRLYIDAHTEDEWRARGFFPVTGVEDNRPAESVLLQMLALRQAHPVDPRHPLPEALQLGILRSNQCAGPREVSSLAREKPYLGMPLGLPGISGEDFSTLSAWVAQGSSSGAAGFEPSPAEIRQIARWERWLNHTSNERRLLARWLFEHWFIAHLYFEDGGERHFFRLVRSRTASGKPVDEIATRRSNDAPGEAFHYRFVPLKGTLVYKTHTTFGLSDSVLQRIQDLFDLPDGAVKTLPGYTEEERANPFLTFAALPAQARYQFMLDHAEYFVRTFIRGPVCRGQLATDVIRDHFWVAFQAPDKDPYLSSAGYRKTVDSLLALPNISDDLLDGAEHWWSSLDNRNAYVEKRQLQLQALFPQGIDEQMVWDGEGHNSNALLTVFRHHDSASVKRGWLGQLPLTAWLMDYPLFERSYYNLVVNFDVFGSLAHQTQVRLYFDLIRNGSEQNFLMLLPAESRKGVMKKWYEGSGKLKLWLVYENIDSSIPAHLLSGSDDQPYPALLQYLLQRLATVNATPDPINRPKASLQTPLQRALSQLTGVPQREMASVGQFPEATLLQVTHGDDPVRVYTLIRNRRHSNVAFVMGESLRYEPEHDDLSVVPGVATGYPNLMLSVAEDDLDAFVATLRDKSLKDARQFDTRIIEPWGVRRTDPGFWDKFHRLTEYLQRTSPVEAGILDLNRYGRY
ncbi:MAG: fatty acid cis/trans isomerase [Candidatus Thiodiazotropha sp.]